MSKSQDLWRSVLKRVKYVSLGEFDHNVHISLRKRFLYVETPKVACSTLKLTLARLELEDPDYDREDVHDRYTSPLLRPSQTGDFEKLLASKSLFKFCFVRNPYERLLSSYLDKVKNGEWRFVQGLVRQLGRDQTDPEQTISFEDFVGSIESTPISMMDSHWRPQYFQTFQPSIDFDFIGRMERFDQDVKALGTHLSEDIARYYRSWTTHRTNARNLLEATYTPELQERVHALYGVDFEAFDYPKALPV